MKITEADEDFRLEAGRIKEASQRRLKRELYHGRYKRETIQEGKDLLLDPRGGTGACHMRISGCSCVLPAAGQNLAENVEN